jgi:hypothetical protein
MRLLGEVRSHGGRWLAAALVLALLPSCFESHAVPIDGERVRVEQTRLNTSSGFLEPMPPVEATVVAWSCDGTWSAESTVDADGHAVFQLPEGLDCWNLTAVDLQFSVGGGASTVLRAPIPFEGTVRLPAGYRDPADASPDRLELNGHVVGLPEGTDAIEITGDVRWDVLSARRRHGHRHRRRARLVFSEPGLDSGSTGSYLTPHHAGRRGHSPV